MSRAVPDCRASGVGHRTESAIRRDDRERGDLAIEHSIADGLGNVVTSDEICVVEIRDGLFADFAGVMTASQQVGAHVRICIDIDAEDSIMLRNVALGGLPPGRFRVRVSLGVTPPAAAARRADRAPAWRRGRAAPRRSRA